MYQYCNALMYVVVELKNKMRSTIYCVNYFTDTFIFSLTLWLRRIYKKGHEIWNCCIHLINQTSKANKW